MSLFFGIKIVRAFNFCYVAMGCILNARVEKISIFHFCYPSNQRNLLTARRFSDLWYIYIIINMINAFPADQLHSGYYVYIREGTMYTSIVTHAMVQLFMSVFLFLDDII